MIRYFLNKTGYSFLTLFGVVTVIFFLFNVLPGDPARMMLDQNEDSEQMAIIKKKYGFDYKHKATLVNIDKIEIKIPIDNNGNFDLEKQIEIANKSRMIKELKEELKQQFEKITTANINVE